MTRSPRALLATALLLLLALLAAWQVPPRLDWVRYRAAIAEMAAARIGRPVQIAGDVHLTLFPHPLLTATNVTLPDRGDGISANLGALRLQVAFWPLLAGHLVPRDLLLDDPVVSVPWPLPRVTPTGVHALPLGFGARVEGGTLLLNGFPLTAIDAEMRADADTGAFAANGTALLAGHLVRFSTLIGAPGADGIATLAVSIDGLEALLGTGGTLRGRLLADGAMAGTISARGPNLSRLLPGPASAWRLQGAVAAAGGTLHAPQLKVLLGQSPGTAGLTLHLAPTPRLEAGIAVGQVALESWPWQPAATRSTLPMRLDLSAAAATWHGTIFRAPHIIVSLTADQAIIEAASATLPENGLLQFAGTLRPQAHGAMFSGPIKIQAPDARALATAVGLVSQQSWPAATPRPLTLQADLHAAPNELSLSNVHATFGTAKIDGGLNATLAPRPALRVTLNLDQLALTDFPPALPNWQSLAGAMNGADLALHLQAGHVALPNITLHQLVLDAALDQARLALHSLTAELPAGHIELAGTIGTDGTVTGGTLDASVPDAATLPATWRLLPGLWHGPLHIAASAAGPPHQIAIQLRCDLNDLRAEAEGHLDPAIPAIIATATLRHPGAPRLLSTLGMQDAGNWIGQGSVALIAHFTAQPGMIEAPDVTLAAGALRIGGQLQLDATTPLPTLSGRIDAPFLTLPPITGPATTPLPLGWLNAWQGNLHVSTGPILLGAKQLADQASTVITAAPGSLTASDITARVAGGTLLGDAALNASPTTGAVWAARFALAGASTDALAVWPPLAWSRGTLDVAGNLTATGYSPAALLASLGGNLTGAVHGVSLQGIDLPRLTNLLTTHAPRLRRALPAALAAGDTGPLTGDVAATLESGALTLTPLTLRGPSGDLALTGSLDLPGRLADLALQIRPALVDPPTLGLRIVGPWQTVRRTTDVGAAVNWAAKK
jgi:hypothetical protein